MRNLWKPLLAVAVLALAALLVSRFLAGPPVPTDDLTNATIDRLEREVDSLRLVVQRRDSAIAGYEVRIAGLDGRLAEIARENSGLLANLNRQRRTIEHVSDDSLARDLNRILRADPLLRVGAAPGVP